MTSGSSVSVQVAEGSPVAVAELGSVVVGVGSELPVPVAVVTGSVAASVPVTDSVAVGSGT